MGETIDIKQLLLHQNEANKQYFLVIHPRSPSRLNSAQYDENCQNWSQLTFKRLATSFWEFRNIDDIWNQHTKLHQKNAGSETLRHKFKSGSHWSSSDLEKPSRFNLTTTNSLTSKTNTRFCHACHQRFPSHSGPRARPRPSVPADNSQSPSPTGTLPGRAARQ